MSVDTSTDQSSHHSGLRLASRAKNRSAVKTDAIEMKRYMMMVYVSSCSDVIPHSDLVSFSVVSDSGMVHDLRTQTFAAACMA